MTTPKFVTFYKPNPAAFGKAEALFPGHVAHVQAHKANGTLLSFGAFADLVNHGSMGVFTSKEAAESFIANDPFVTGGIVATHEVREWTDMAG